MRCRGYLLLLIAVSACKRAPEPAATTPTGTVATIQTDPKPDAGPSRSAEPAEDTQLRKFLWNWVTAQNDGDFSSYRAKYAAQFEAVIRTGKRARTVKSTAWMKAQQLLFAKPQTVVTYDEKFQATGDHGEIRLVRTVDSGTYHEQSERLLAVGRDAEGWHIVREEVLSNAIDPSQGSAVDQMAYALIWDGDVVLADDVGDAWVAGRPHLREPESGVAVAKAEETALPPIVRVWKREPLRLIDAQLNECQATVIGFEIIAHSEWDMGTIRGETGDNDRKAAAKIWGGAKHFLVAKLSSQEGDCKDPLLARPARLPRGKFFGFEDASDAIGETGKKLFNSLPDVIQLTAEVRTESPDWEEDPRVSVGKAGKAGFLLSARNLGPAGCGEPGFYADALWRSPNGRAKGKWELVHGLQSGMAATHELIFDDGTGKLRVVYTGNQRMGVLVCPNGEDGKDTACTVDRELKVPYSDCTC